MEIHHLILMGVGLFVGFWIGIITVGLRLIYNNRTKNAGRGGGINGEAGIRQRTDLRFEI